MRQYNCCSTVPDEVSGFLDFSVYLQVPVAVFRGFGIRAQPCSFAMWWKVAFGHRFPIELQHLRAGGAKPPCLPCHHQTLVKEAHVYLTGVLPVLDSPVHQLGSEASHSPPMIRGEWRGTCLEQGLPHFEGALTVSKGHVGIRDDGLSALSFGTVCTISQWV